MSVLALGVEIGRNTHQAPALLQRVSRRWASLGGTALLLHLIPASLQPDSEPYPDETTCRQLADAVTQAGLELILSVSISSDARLFALYVEQPLALFSSHRVLLEPLPLQEQLSDFELPHEALLAPEDLLDHALTYCREHQRTILVSSDIFERYPPARERLPADATVVVQHSALRGGNQCGYWQQHNIPFLVQPPVGASPFLFPSCRRDLQSVETAVRSGREYGARGAVLRIQELRYNNVLSYYWLYAAVLATLWGQPERDAACAARQISDAWTDGAQPGFDILHQRLGDGFIDCWPGFATQGMRKLVQCCPLPLSLAEQPVFAGVTAEHYRRVETHAHETQALLHELMHCCCDHSEVLQHLDLPLLLHRYTIQRVQSERSIAQTYRQAYLDAEHDARSACLPLYDGAERLSALAAPLDAILAKTQQVTQDLGGAPEDVDRWRYFQLCLRNFTHTWHEITAHLSKHTLMPAPEALGIATAPPA